LIISMQDGEKLSLEQIRAFLEASEAVHFEGKRRREVYEWITRLLRQQGYRTQGKVVRGLLRRYVAKMTGRSRAGDTADRPVPETQRGEGIQSPPPPV
jgi:hypothetical protein